MIFIVVKKQVKPEYANNFAVVGREFTAGTRAEPGNLFFDWFRSVDNPNTYLLVEAFHDAAAGEAHVNSPHFQAAMARSRNWLVGNARDRQRRGPERRLAPDVRDHDRVTRYATTVSSPNSVCPTTSPR